MLETLEIITLEIHASSLLWKYPCVSGPTEKAIVGVLHWVQVETNFTGL